MTNQAKLTTIVFTILLTLAFAVPTIPVSAFDSPVPTHEPTPRPAPPRPTPPAYVEPAPTWHTQADAHHERPHDYHHEPSETQVVLASEPEQTIDWQGLGFIVEP